MRKILFLISGCFLAMGIGCAQPPSQTKELADDTVDQIKTTSASVDAMGTPNASWSDADLDKLKALLNDLQKQTTQARTYTGKVGSIIEKSVGFDRIDRSVNAKKLSLEQVRTEKSVQTAKDQRTETLRKLEVQKAFQVQALFKMGEPSSAWSAEMLNRYVDQIGQIEKTIDQQVAIEGETESSKSSRESLKGLREVGYLRKATKP